MVHVVIGGNIFTSVSVPCFIIILLLFIFIAHFYFDIFIATIPF